MQKTGQTGKAQICLWQANAKSPRVLLPNPIAHQSSSPLLCMCQIIPYEQFLLKQALSRMSIPLLDTYFLLVFPFICFSSFLFDFLFPSPVASTSVFMMDYLTFREDNDLTFFLFFSFPSLISSSRMTSNQLGASTILQTRPNMLGKNQCKYISPSSSVPFFSILI